MHYANADGMHNDVNNYNLLNVLLSGTKILALSCRTETGVQRELSILLLL